MLFLLWAPLDNSCVQCALYGHGAHNKNTLVCPY